MTPAKLRILQQLLNPACSCGCPCDISCCVNTAQASSCRLFSSHGSQESKDLTADIYKFGQLNRQLSCNDAASEHGQEKILHTVDIDA